MVTAASPSPATAFPGQPPLLPPLVDALPSLLDAAGPPATDSSGSPTAIPIYSDLHRHPRLPSSPVMRDYPKHLPTISVYGGGSLLVEEERWCSVLVLMIWFGRGGRRVDVVGCYTGDWVGSGGDIGPRWWALSEAGDGDDDGTGLCGGVVEGFLSEGGGGGAALMGTMILVVMLGLPSGGWLSGGDDVVGRKDGGAGGNGWPTLSLRVDDDILLHHLL